jgi:multimeric flavodoxin WrbA
MNPSVKITAIVGTYRKNGVIDRAVDELLDAARSNGAETTKIYLLDKHVEFCTNCRSCTQQEGVHRGKCPIEDELNGILDQLDSSDAFVLASPMNFFTVTALMKRFIERMVGYAYWPWGNLAPKFRNPRGTKYAVLVGSSACPGFLARLLTPMMGLLKKVARTLGAKKTDILYIGLAGGEQHPDIGDRVKKKARRLGKKLATHPS